MDEQLINEYINNLANKVNNLTQENILLTTRLAIIEKREKDRLEAEAKKEESLAQYDTPSDYSQPEAKEEKPIPPLVRAPKPKGYNPQVDGPLPMVPNPKLAKE